MTSTSATTHPDSADQANRSGQAGLAATDGEIASYLDMTTRHLRPGTASGGWPYRCPQALITALAGPERTAHPHTRAGMRPGEPRLCFANATSAAQRDPGLLYVEGWALASFMPVPHAWCIDASTGEIFDPTWIHLDHLDGGPATYLGVAYATEFVTAATLTSDNAAMLHADYTRDHRLLRGDFTTATHQFTAPPPDAGTEITVITGWAS